VSAAGDRQQAGSCSVLSASLAESAYGSAATAQAWVCLQQDGPWGAKAPTQSHLDPELGRWLDKAVDAAGGRLALLRTPGAHPDDHHAGRRQVLVAWCVPGEEWLLAGSVRSPDELRDLDLAALAEGDRDAVARSLPALALSDQPHLLVCTNGRRDVCCAVQGRPVAQGADAQRPARVWETSHTGGHRYAPTAVLLPSGQTLARVDAGQAVEALDAAARGELAAGLLGPVHDRGRSGLPAQQQAAESAVRAATGEVALAALTSAPAEPAGVPADGSAGVVAGGPADADTWGVTVAHRDGRSWRALVRRVVEDAERPESCAKGPVPLAHWTVELDPPD
jgi:hypothetical protein